ncbi:MAG: hypothetical protein H0W43_04030 [Chthoniobacterales bacterium]|nr:hypothetical protein [Chthoniobacterales bacterium]
MHRHLRRLERVWIDQPIYFITPALFGGGPSLPLPRSPLFSSKNGGKPADATDGRSVATSSSDHVHFFCAQEKDARPLSIFVGSWKQWTSKAIARTAALALVPPIWQEEFFDHALRSSESYSEKWNYVRENPVRADLVASPDEWPWQGEIEELRF